MRTTKRCVAVTPWRSAAGEFDRYRQCPRIKVMEISESAPQRGDRVPQFQYTAVFEPSTEGGFIVTVPALPGLVTEGDTIEEAREMVKDAIRGYLESLIKHGEGIPIEPNPASVERVAVNL